jgi:hypothetical protein
LPVALVGCATPASMSADPGSSPGETLYTVSTMVLQDPSHGPGLCGVVGFSHPPVCSNVPITNWDWDVVEDEMRVGHTTWGQYTVVGTYDGAALTLTRSAVTTSESSPKSQPSDFRTPCDEPADGWTSRDPSRASDADRAAALASANKASDFAGAWVDGKVLNVAFTGSLADHETNVRGYWGGPLCIVHHERTLTELQRVADELTDQADVLFNVQLLGVEADDVVNVVRLDLVLATHDTQGELDERYGEGVVVVHSWLQPV